MVVFEKYINLIHSRSTPKLHKIALLFTTCRKNVPGRTKVLLLSMYLLCILCNVYNFIIGPNYKLRSSKMLFAAHLINVMQKMARVDKAWAVQRHLDKDPYKRALSKRTRFQSLLSNHGWSKDRLSLGGLCGSSQLQHSFFVEFHASSQAVGSRECRH